MSMQVSFEDLLKIKDADRSVRAYAFLDATLRVSSGNPNPTRDILDCFLPFVAAGVAAQAGNQLDTQALRSYLKNNFGFDVPLYALEQFIAPLENIGSLRYERNIQRHVCLPMDRPIGSDRQIALSDFDDLVEKLHQFAKSAGVPTPPVSRSWTDAFINFLKGLQEGPPANRTAKVKGVLLADGGRVEQYVLGRFIEDASRSDQQLYEKVLSVFKGVLIEDFVAGAIQVAEVERINDLTIFYDTAVLMRLLGCSGTLLLDATVELHRYLQDLGAATEYLHVNEEEVANILSTIVGAKDAGYAIFGETGEAVERGECTIADLRLLTGMFPERLAAMSIFENKKSVNNIHNVQRFQIDETAFEGYLDSAASSRGIPYKKENRRNDAQALGTTIVFRRGHKSRDALKSRVLFITSNKLLAMVSRSFLIDNNHLRWHECPPILHVGQIATIAWLLKSKQLDDRVVSRELLANCYAAYRPEPEWLDKFVEAFGRAAEYNKSGGEQALRDGIVLQAARRIAQDQTYGRPALLKSLNMAEIIALAEKQKEFIASENLASGKALGLVAAKSENVSRQRQRAEAAAAKTALGLEIFVLLISVAVVVIQGLQSNLTSWAKTLIVAFGLLLSLVSLLDLFGYKLVGSVWPCC